MAQLKSTHINGILTIDPESNSNDGGGSDKRINFALPPNGDLLNHPPNVFDVPLAYMGPKAPMKIDLGSSDAPWLRTHTRAIRFYASNPVDNKPSNKLKPALAGRIWIPDDTLATDTLVETTLQLQLGARGDDTNPSFDGEILMYNKQGGSTLLVPPSDSSKTYTRITLPEKAGTLALEGHTHNFTTEIPGITWKNFWYTGNTGSAGIPNGDTEAERKKFHLDMKGTVPATEKQVTALIKQADKNRAFVKLKNCYLWGSDDLDIFVIRGHATVKPVGTDLAKTENRKITLGYVYVTEENKNVLPAGLVPMSVYRKVKSPCANGVLYAREKDGDGYSCEIAVRYPGVMKAGYTYDFYFTATYGKIGATNIEDELDNDPDELDK
jgi:hypothetical protein